MHSLTTHLPFAAALVTALLSAPLRGQTNTLLIVADDVGVDAISIYKEGKAPPPTPNIDSLAQSGVLFRNAYANPICSPTRATLHTGRYGLRTGVGAVVSRGASEPLPHAEYSLPELTGNKGFATALFGKWHLGDSRNGGDKSPNLAGWSHFAGHMWNIAGGETYYSWRKVVNGSASTSRVYATTDNVDDAITWIKAQKNSWVCCLSFNAAHGPFHAPPAALHTYNLSGKSPALTPVPFFKAMVQAMDTEIGRLFKSLGATVMSKTNVIFVGDNGTPPRVSQAPFTAAHAKTTLYEGGINVPLIISGPAVKSRGREERDLVASVDLFSTVLELSGIDQRTAVPRSIPLDGISLVPYLSGPVSKPLRSLIYAERYGSSSNIQEDGFAISNGVYKSIRWIKPVREAFFDLSADPFEKNNLLLGKLNSVQQANYDALAAELWRLRADSFPFGKGCQGSAGTPRLDLVANGLPRVGRNFTVQVAGMAMGTTFAVGVAGLSDEWEGGLALPLKLDALGMPGCELAVSLTLLFPVGVTKGQALWTIPVPNVPNFLGAKFYEQAFVAEIGANAGNTIATHALRLVIGSS